MPNIEPDIRSHFTALTVSSMFRGESFHPLGQKSYIKFQSFLLSTRINKPYWVLSCCIASVYNSEILHKPLFLLRKIALPYPHKCLLGFVEAKRGDQQEYLKIILVREVNPVVSDRCACAQHIVGWTLSRDLHSIFGRRGGNT